MPCADELIAHGREAEQISDKIQADRLIFQDLDALIHAVNCEHPELNAFETSVFNGDYITGDVDQSYLEHLAEVAVMVKERLSSRTRRAATDA